MSEKLQWDKTGEHFYETGVDRGVLYDVSDEGVYENGVAWNGLINVTEKPSGAEATALYADNIKYLNLISVEEFGASIEAYTYPDEFGKCDGSASLAPGVSIGQQGRKTFGLSYRTLIGNDIEGSSFGYKIHLIYGATVTPTEKSYGTESDSPEAIAFSWDLATVPVSVTGNKPTASLVIDSTKITPEKLAELEQLLYGETGVKPRMPLPDEILSLVSAG